MCYGHTGRLNMESMQKKSCFANDRLRVSVTDTCNLTCEYCSNEGQNHNRKKYLRFDHYLQILNKIKQENIYIRKLNVTGGEPLLHPELSKILSASVDVAEEVTLNTNGLLLSRKKIDELFFIGIKNIKFGVDSIFEDVIKPSKNKPKYDRSRYIDNMLYAIEIMPRSSLNVVMSEFNANQIESMLDFIIKNDIDKVEFLEIIEHDFRNNDTPPRRVLTARDIVARFASKFSKIEYNKMLAKYMCFLSNGLMIQFAEDFCRRGVCQNLWTRMDTNCKIAPCIKNDKVFSLDMRFDLFSQLKELNVMMCNSTADNFPWEWSGAIQAGVREDNIRKNSEVGEILGDVITYTNRDP